MTLDGKAALVTGGSRGIGEAVAIRLAEDGADVALTYHSQAERAADVVDRIKALGRRAWAVRVDGADAQEVRAAVERGRRRVRPTGHPGQQRGRRRPRPPRRAVAGRMWTRSSP